MEKDENWRNIFLSNDGLEYVMVLLRQEDINMLWKVLGIMHTHREAMAAKYEPRTHLDHAIDVYSSISLSGAQEAAKSICFSVWKWFKQCINQANK